MIGQNGRTSVIQQVETLIEMIQSMTYETDDMASVLSVILIKCQAIVKQAQSVKAQQDRAVIDTQISLRLRQVTLDKRCKKLARMQQWFLKLPILGHVLRGIGTRKYRGVSKQLSRVDREIQTIQTKDGEVNQLITAVDLLVFELSQAVLGLKKRRDNRDNKALKSLETSWLDLYQEWHGLNNLPSYLNQTTHRSFIRYLLKEESRLRQDGWQSQGIKSYFTLVSDEAQRVTDSQALLNRQKEFRQESRLVGSTVYERMYAALEGYTEAQLQEKAQLPIRQLGGYIDENGMLQLSGPFSISPNLSPDSRFLESYAATVKQAYPRGLLPAVYGFDDPSSNAYQTIKGIHQFRMYLDRQNIFYIRANYQGETDYDKLLAFEKEAIQRCGKGGYLNYSSNSKFHNRTSQERPFDGQHNDKIKSHNGLSEFIVRVKVGSFATQWDNLRTVDNHSFFIREAGRVIGLRQQLVNSNPNAYELKGLNGKEIVDTESFNYSARDNRKIGDLSHSLLDVEPANAGLGLEHDVKILAKQTWKTQTVDSYGNRGRDRYTTQFKPSSNK